VLDLSSALALAALVHFEHFKSIRPSLLTCLVLLITSLLDVARVRSAWMQLPSTGWTASLTASLIARVLLLAVESRGKESLLIVQEKAWSKESTGGPFNLALFLWLNRLLITGWQAVLRPDSLPGVDERLDVDHVYKRLQKSWIAGELLPLPAYLPLTDGLQPTVGASTHCFWHCSKPSSLRCLPLWSLACVSSVSALPNPS
jgi:hypothetical protein